MAIGIGIGIGLPFGGRASGALSLLASHRVMFIGDSRPAGRGAGSGATFMDGARALSYPAKTLAYLQTAGFAGWDESYVGDAQNGLANLVTYNTKLTFPGAGGAPASASESPGQGGVMARLDANDQIDFAPGSSVDRAEVYAYTNTGFGTLRVYYNGVQVGTDWVQTTPVTTFGKTTYSFTKGTNTVRLERVSGAARAAALVCYASDENGYIIINAGVREWSTADWQVATNAASPFNSVDEYVGAGDLIFVDIGTNDVRTSVSEATFAANYDALIVQYQATGAYVYCCLPAPAQADVVAGVSYAQIRSNITSIASSRSAGLVDLQTASGTWAAMDAAGETVDGYHFTAPVMTRIGNLIGETIEDHAAANGWLG